MSSLILIKDSWQGSAWLYERLAYASAGDAIVLREDAVLALHSPISLASFVAKCAAATVTLYAISDDLVLRGVENRYADVTEIDDTALVQLVLRYDKQVSW